MLSTVQIQVPPAIEPIPIALLRSHIRVDQTDDDLLLAGFLTAARTAAELYLSRALITQTLIWTMQPSGSVWRRDHRLHWTLELPRAPVQSVTSVIVTDDYGNVSPILPAIVPFAPPGVLLGYMADLAFTLPRLKIGRSTPLIDGRTLRQANLESIQVVFVAGYGDDAATIPQPILNAIAMGAAYLYEHRGDTEAEMPRAFEWLLDPYRMLLVS